MFVIVKSTSSNVVKFGLPGYVWLVVSAVFVMVQLLCVVSLQPRRRRRALVVSSQDPSSVYAMTSESVYSAPVSHVHRS